LEAGTKTEKHNVSFGGAVTFKFDIFTCLNRVKVNASETEKQDIKKIETIIKELKDFESNIKEKTFTTLIDSTIDNFLCDQGENITMFPVELFKLKNCNLTLEGEKTTGVHCFFLRGKLMEVTITRSKNPYIALIQKISHPSFPPSMIYIPSLHL
jgi:hypothetical protein